MPVSEAAAGKDKPEAIEAAEEERKSRSASKVSEHQNNSESGKLDGALDTEEIEQIKGEQTSSIE
jgi:hypothetical protein